MVGALFACVSLVAGCVAPNQRQAKPPAPSVADQLTACMLAVRNSDDAAPLRARIPFDAREATLAQMTDPAKASDGEIKAIYVLHPRVKSCRREALDKLTGPAPAIAAIMGDTWEKSEQSLIDLVQRKITWGEYVRRVKEITAAATKELAVAVQRERRDEAAQRQAALDARARFRQTQRIIDAMSQRPTMDCMTMGNMTHCF
jgi:hypothetical protein